VAPISRARVARAAENPEAKIRVQDFPDRPLDESRRRAEAEQTRRFIGGFVR
jgi:hypothetical protein